jgi:hypothetical protein
VTRNLVVAAAQVEDAPVPHVAPVAGGGVQIEWHLARKELEIEILPSGVVSFVQVEGEAETQGSFALDRATNASGLVEWLVR